MILEVQKEKYRTINTEPLSYETVKVITVNNVEEMKEAVRSFENFKNTNPSYNYRLIEILTTSRTHGN